MSGRWGALVVLCLARVSMGLHLQVLAAVSPFLMADLGLGYGEVGTLIGLFMLPGAVLAIPGGLVSRRFGDRQSLMLGIVLLAFGTALLALSNGFWLAALARVVSGAGGTLLTMQVAKIATDWFAGRELSTAIGVLLGTFPLGIATVMAGLPVVATFGSWRQAAALVAGSAVMILIVVAAWLRDPPRDERDEPTARSRLWLISGREIVLVMLAGAAFSLLNAGLVVFTSFTPVLLLRRGLDEVQAGLLASWTSWLLIGTLPLAGYLLDRVRWVNAWLVGSAALSALVCLGLTSLEPAWLWIVMSGIVMAPIGVGSMALPGEVLRPESRSTGFGVFFTTNYVGFGLLPAVAGLLVDLTGSAAASLWFAGAVFAAIAPLILAFRWVQARQLPLAERLGEAPATPGS